MDIKKDAELFLNIEKEFFIINDEDKTCEMNLLFTSPDEIFDKNSITKIPVFNDDFIEWLQSAFDYAPKKYKIILNVEFDDLNGYKEEELHEIFIKNLALEIKKIEKTASTKNRIALNFIILGVIFFIGMVLVGGLMDSKSIGVQILESILEIASWVTIWEAITIIVIDTKERRSYMSSMAKRFKSIVFKKKKNKE